MKTFILVLVCLLTLNGQAQEHFCAKAKQHSAALSINARAREAAISSAISHEVKYDVKFVKLDLHLENNTTYIEGGVTTVATVTAAVMDTFMTVLHQNHTIDSLRFNGVLQTAVRQDSMVKVGLPSPLNTGSSFTVSVYYKGTPPVGGSAIGSGFSTLNSSYSYNNDVTWSLSEPFVAYHWWPCKQILTDKIDSSWVFVTTDSANKVGSNGRLTNVVLLGNKKRHEWKSRTPINYYLISVALAKYGEYNFYVKPQYLVNDSILVQNYVYANALTNPSWIANDKVELDKLPDVIKLYSNLFGMYPFYKEKYGHCMAPFGGGEEHQTMTSLLYFENYLDAHELGHQWWGDNVTCATWSDIWLNEGFATYTEFVTAWYLDNANFQSYLGYYHTLVMSQAGGSIYFTNNDTMNVNRIFNSRLSYAKGGSMIRTLQFLTNNDSLWFNTLRGFQNTYKNSNASTVDFKNYYQAQTGIDPTQFFNQWFYGEGYPTFNVKYNKIGDTFILKSSQAVSMPAVTPLFITPMEYRVSRTGYPDTLIRVMHNVAVETYTFAMAGTVTQVRCDPNNWVINKTVGPSLDGNLNTGISPISNPAMKMSIGPNPGFGTYTLHNPGHAIGSLVVWDLSGRRILEKKMDGDTAIDLTRFANGLYEVRVFNEDGDELFTRKIIKD